MLGVHANTVRSWTDQGMLHCLRINHRGDRRYAVKEIRRFMSRAGGASSGDGLAEAGSTIEILARTALAAANGTDVRAVVGAIANVLSADAGYHGATLLTADGRELELIGKLHADRRLAARATACGRPLSRPLRAADGSYRVALPVGTGAVNQGVLLLEGAHGTRTIDETTLLAGVCAQLDLAAVMCGQSAESAQRQRRAELVLSIEGDLSTRLDPAQVLRQLVDRAVEAFGAQHAGVFSRQPNGSHRALITRNLSVEFSQCIEHASSLPLTAQSIDHGRALAVIGYVDDPRALELRPALIREGIDTIAVAPLVADGQTHGVLALYHDAPHAWSADDITLLERLALRGAAVMRNAQDYSRMATWAAQLQSIQQLGARLTRLRSVAEIGQAICAELNQLIDTHNTRVYRVAGEDCIPVAWRGQIGEYLDENGDQLRLKVGEGVTGWVARHGLAQNVPDAAHDRRAKTIPGTDGDLDESLLLAPMLYEDQVIGVIVLAKLGLSQFTVDDLRLLEIYASIAAQAMANADVTERLREQSETLARQVASQRELLRVTESILSTLDTQQLLQEIAERLNALVEVDNISVLRHDPADRRLHTIFARGVHARQVRNASLAEHEGICGVALETGEAQLVPDQLSDLRVAHLAGLAAEPGALIAAPLHAAERVQGVLVLERLGAGVSFSDEEFELVKLFAAHVSIALRNAATHRAVELRAETDLLTGLWNHGALIEQIDRMARPGQRFAMLMLDLDHFKDVNDNFGHQAGNVVLQRVAQQLKESCRGSDLVFRYGGDEFALLLPNTGIVGARTVAEKVLAAIIQIGQQGNWGSLTASIGIATFSRDGHDGPSIILAADRACYAGKRAGRNRIATAAEGLALAAGFQPTEPTPIDTLEPAYSAA